MDKTCNQDCYCQYRIPGGCMIACKYSGFCDFQTPRDSRTREILDLRYECTCGTSAKCKFHTGEKV